MGRCPLILAAALLLAFSTALRAGHNETPVNPSATVLGGVESIAAGTNLWIDSISTAGVPHQSQPAFSNLSGSLAQAQAPTGGSVNQFWQTNGSGTGAWASTRIILCGGSGSVASGAGATDFLGKANLSTTETIVEFPMPYPGTVSLLYVSAGASSGKTNGYAYTLRKNGASPASGPTCTISSTTGTACNDAAHSVAFVAGDLLDVQLVTAASSNLNPHSYCLGITTP